ncbi:alpha/beta fold hydrolase [Dactylosporangium matsuzakiense]|nr:alpha/beta hydrolase [Dactylosporangium matsuzakiense]UWZ41250.1 alpha/beta hydrolase [Dactylosporangium matsuzakiense]
MSSVFLAMVAPPSTAFAEGTDPSWASCSAQTVTVTVSATDPTPYTVRGRLCTAADSLRGAKTVELFVSGLTYDHNYFNSPTQPNTYSYVYAATSRGYSTFNIDRLGVGLSDHPPSSKLTLQSHAYVIAQIVQKLRTGVIGGISFVNVVGVGHSFGAAILQYLAGTTTNAATRPDFLVLQDFLMTTYAPGLAVLGSALYTAASDPAFASAGLDSGYITTMPNTRGTAFYRTAGAEAAMITMDESIKQTGTLTERSSLGAARNPAVTLAITVPVLITVGQYDTFYCDEPSGLTCATSAAVKTREGVNFGPRACLSTYVVLDGGHATGFHIKARDSYNFAHSWVDKYTINPVKDANGCVA